LFHAIAKVRILVPNFYDAELFSSFIEFLSLRALRYSTCQPRRLVSASGLYESVLSDRQMVKD
jgi:hypothetical protein